MSIQRLHPCICCRVGSEKLRHIVFDQYICEKCVLEFLSENGRTSMSRSEWMFALAEFIRKKQIVPKDFFWQEEKLTFGDFEKQMLTTCFGSQLSKESWPFIFGSMARDAIRYRWLRKQHWNDSTVSVVRDPKSSVKLGYDCPSERQLDELIDAEIAKLPDAPSDTSNQPKCCKEYREQGWRFYYDSETRFVGVRHPNGGHQSIAELRVVSVWGLDSKEIGHAIAKLLNGESPC